jgi:septum site-determining protein MinC
MFPIKGYKEGLLVTLGDGEWEEIQSMLLNQIDSERNFFNGAKVAIDIGERILRVSEMIKLRDELINRDVNLFALLSNSSVNDVNAESLALETKRSALSEDIQGSGVTSLDGDRAILIQKTIRSGTSVKSTGHVIVDGDINPGGEVFSTGSIYVWGKLRGSVHAGMEGSLIEVICAMELDPIKLRIANIAFKQNKLLTKFKRKPVKLKITKDKLVMDYWFGK